MRNYEIKLKCRKWEDQIIIVNYIPRIGESITTPEGGLEHEFMINKVTYDYNVEHQDSSYGLSSITLDCDLIELHNL